jgi:DNA-binding XRE family transcriptional regulator
MPAKLGGRNELGLALTFLRWMRGWDQEELADASGTSLDSIKAIEQGQGARPSWRLPRRGRWPLLGNQLDLLRVDWRQGTVAAGISARHETVTTASCH